MTSLRNKAVHGAKWQVLAVACQAIITLVTMAIYARFISKESFGQFAIVNVFMLFVISITEFGLGASLVQLKQFKQTHISFAFYGSLALGLIAFTVLYASSPWITQFYDNQFDPLVLQVLSLNLIIRSAGVVSQSLLIRNFDFKKLFLSIVLANGIGGLGLGVWMAYHDFQIWALVYSLLVINGLIVLLNYVFTRHSVRPVFSRADSTQVLSFGGGLTVMKLVSQLGNSIDKLILGKYVPMQAVGFYERAFYISNLPKVYLARSVDNVLFSTLARVQDNKRKLADGYLNTLTLISLCMSVIATNLFFFPDWFVTILLGSNWEEAVPILQIFSIYAFLIIFVKFSDTVLKALNKVWGGSIIKALFTVSKFCIILALAYAPFRTIAIGAVAAYAIHAILMLLYVSKIASIRLSDFLDAFYPVFILFSILVVKNIVILFFGWSNVLFVFMTSLLVDAILLLSSFIWMRNIFKPGFLPFVRSFLQWVPDRFATRIDELWFR